MREEASLVLSAAGSSRTHSRSWGWNQWTPAASLVSRFVAGAFSGIIWGILSAYGRKISPPSRAGLSLAIVSVGAPVGFALGTPLGSWLGTTFDWRWAFAGLTAAAVIAGVIIAAIAPDAEGQPGTSRLPPARVFRSPGIAVILAVIFT